MALVLVACAESRGVDSDEAFSRVRFTDVTEEAGLGAFRHDNGGRGEKWMPEIVGPGAAFIDYDGDGWDDLLLAGGGSWDEDPEARPQAIYLFRNNGDGTFTDVTNEAGLAEVRTYPFGFAVGDYDNDGHQDFLLTTLFENMLFRNNGDGTFTEVGREAGIADTSLWSTSAIFFDADRDGHLDLFVVNYVHWTPETDIFCGYQGEKGYCTPQLYEGVPSMFYRNNGDGTFTNQTREAGFLDGIPAALEKGLAVTDLDFNNNGWPDLFVANDTERDLLYENNRDGTFTERSVRSGVAFDQHGRARAGMGTDTGVVDSTGEVTIMVGNFSHETVGVYRHAGDGYFMDRAQSSRIGHPSLMTLTFGLFLFDVDLDGHLDLFLANGHVQEHIEELVEGVAFEQPAQLFLNRGDGIFDELKQPRGVFTTPMVARGAAYADIDGDGDLDVVVIENDGPVHLWRNDSPVGNHLRVRVEGTESNRDGFGTRIVAQIGDFHMERRIRGGSTYLSQSEKVATFGLGSHQAVDSLIVIWPSGLEERFANVSGNRELLLVEGTGRLEPFRRAGTTLTQGPAR